MNAEEFDVCPMPAPNNIGAMFLKRRSTFSYHGHTKEMLFSAIQKYIRRGLYEKALWCVIEVERFKHLLHPAILDAYLADHPDRNAKDTKSQVKGIQTNLLNRFKVICVEDVGIAHPGLCSIIDVLINEWESRKRLNPAPLIKIVYHLCHARKLRIISDLKSVYHLPPYYGENQTEEARIVGFIERLRQVYNIPPETRLETMETNDLSVFYWVSRNVGSITKTHPIWQMLMKRNPKFRIEFECLQRWFGQNIRENVLFLYQAILLSIMPSLTKLPVVVLDDISPATYDNVLCSRLRQIDQYCNDKHVIGSGEKSVTRFALEGAICMNEAEELRQPGYRELYVHLKKAIDLKRNLSDEELLSLHDSSSQSSSSVIRFDPKGATEKNSVGLDSSGAEIRTRTKRTLSSSGCDEEGETSSSSQQAERLRPTPPSQPLQTTGEQTDLTQKAESAFSFVVRAQVNTSAAKADAYFGVDPSSGEFLLIKGPLQSIEYAQNSLNMNQWKRDNGLPFMPSLRIEYLVPDRWASIPLGYRNKVNHSSPAPFLLAESTIAEATIRQNITTYGAYKSLTGTEKWPPETEIVDWSRVPSHIKVSELSDGEMADYVLLLLARYIFGVSDLADRNFLRKDGHILSIDEEYRDRPVNFKNELKQAKCSIIKSWLVQHFDALIKPKVERWGNIPEKLSAKFGTVRDRVSCLALF
mmetsp:Transcript_15666/g.21493  ORF Transcript_15666/g.21493 Transcript_15666/m.21493 type:complete len:698 (+) Transcript_15666:227-2320(+)